MHLGVSYMLERKLLEATQQADHEKMQYYLQQGANIEGEIDLWKDTITSPLQVAVHNKDITAVKLLLESGANPKAKYHNSPDAFILAILFYPCREIVELLLQYGCQFATPLHRYSYEGNLALVTEYVEKNPDSIYSLDKNNFNAVFYATAQGHQAIVHYLYSKDAHLHCTAVNYRDSYDNANYFDEYNLIYFNPSFAWELAIKHHHFALAAMLLQLDNVTRDSKDCRYAQALLLAVRWQHEELVEHILQQFDYSLFYYPNEIEPLRLAVKLGNIAIIRYFFTYGANIKQFKNNELLVIAVDYGQLDCLKHLVALGFDLKGSNHDDETILQTAITTTKTNLALLEYLLEQGLTVQLQATNHDSESLLYQIVHDDKYALLEFLCQKKLLLGYEQTSLPDQRRYSQRCLQLLVDHGFTSAQQLMTEHRRDKKVFYRALYENNLELVKIMYARLGEVWLLNHWDRFFNVNYYSTSFREISYEELPIDTLEWLIKLPCFPLNHVNQCLLHAVGIGHTDLVAYLVAIGASLNVKSGYDECTVLTLAVKKQHYTTAKWLLEQSHVYLDDFEQTGSTPSQWDSYGYNPLGIAITKNNRPLIKLLLEHGAKIYFAQLPDGYRNDKYSIHFYAPLDLAVATHNPELLELLLDHDPTIAIHLKRYLSKTTTGDSWLSRIVVKDIEKDTEFFNFLIKKVTEVDPSFKLTEIFNQETNNLTEIFGQDTNLLSRIVANGNFDLLKYLIAEGVLIQSVENIQRAMLLAVKHDQLKILQYIAAQGFSLDFTIIVNRSETTLLVEAVKMRYMHIVKWLLAKGVSLTVETSPNRNIFLDAVKSGDVDIVKLLYAQKADIHAINKKGKNAFYLSVARNFYEFAVWLKTLGVAMNIKNWNGGTALHSLIERYYKQDKQDSHYLYYRSNFNHSISSASIIKMLKLGLSVVAKNAQDETLLMCAIMYPIRYPKKSDGTSLFKLLYTEANEVIDLEQSNKKGLTTLLLAAKHRHLPAFEYLLGLGANTMAIDNEGNTLLHWVIESCGNWDNYNNKQKPAMHLLNFLFNHEPGLAFIDQKNHANKTAFDLAVDNDLFQLAEFLLQKGASIYKDSHFNADNLMRYSYKEILMTYGAGIGGQLNSNSCFLGSRYFEQEGDFFDHKVMIDFKLDGIIVTRDTPRFEKAITTLDEYNQHKNLISPMQKQYLLKACLNYEKLQPNNLVVKAFRKQLTLDCGLAIQSLIKIPHEPHFIKKTYENCSFMIGYESLGLFLRPKLNLMRAPSNQITEQLTSQQVRIS